MYNALQTWRNYLNYSYILMDLVTSWDVIQSNLMNQSNQLWMNQHYDMWEAELKCVTLLNGKLSHCGICFRSAALWKDEVTLIFVWQGKGPNKGR